ncbi:MAG: dockerin type I domain-containing protein, partial [Phycisphaerales bacterium]|nr:dockerin type I domain-containing protein [Phycisphaerales bacterium]
QGCCHAAADGGGCENGGYFPYSKGHRAEFLPSLDYATVMAYRDGRTVFRAPRFSNPGIDFEGVPTGVSGDSENARTINETAFDVANYRCTVIPEDGSVAHLMSTGIELPGSQGGTVEVFFADVLFAETSGDVVFGFNGMHSVQRHFDVEVGGLDLGTVQSSESGYCRSLSDERRIDPVVFNDLVGPDGSLVFRITLDQIGSTIDMCEDLSITVTYVAEGACTPNSTDSDGDGTPDCDDACPNDPKKTDPGLCGCGLSDADTDLDGVPDCNDGCPNDSGKSDPGVCGCGVPDDDLDGNGIPDCLDGGEGRTFVVDDDLQEDPGADYTTIQEAVDAALGGDTILVQPGRYTGTSDNVVLVRGKGIRLIAVGGHSQTIIDCEGARGGIRCEILTGDELIIEGFTVESHSSCFSAGGDPPDCSSGILVVANNGASALVDSCIVRDGSGLALSMVGRSPNSGDPELVVRDTMVLGNVGPFGSGADWLMSASYSSEIRFESCAFIGNTAGQMMLSYWAAPEFTDCVFVDNELVPVTGPYPSAVLFHDPQNPVTSDDIMQIDGCRFVESSGSACLVDGNGDTVRMMNSFACASGGAPVICGEFSDTDIDLSDDCPVLDCNENGITDAIEIFAGDVDDMDRDGIPDCCQTGGSCFCTGDLDGDGFVSGTDLAFVLAAWGQTALFPEADINRDGAVDGIDLAFLLSDWGPCGG